MTQKILLISKDQALGSTLQPWLTQCQYDVIVATEGGDEGILAAVTQSPDLILVDTDLPVIGGWQVITILKASSVTQNIPVIALTQPTTDAEWNKVLESRCDACELKPVDLASILAKVKILLDPKVVPPPAIGVEESAGANLLLFPDPPRSSMADAVIEQTVSSDSLVVYIDDNISDSQTMGKIVQKAGYGYGSIAEPLEAMPMLLEVKPQLIFLDLMMPFINGYELCAQIRRVSALKTTSIVIVTSNDGLIDRARAKFVGASEFFSKPIQEKRVLQVLKKYLSPMENDLPPGVRHHGLLPLI